MSIKSASVKSDIKKALSFSREVAAVLVVDIGQDLKLVNVALAGEPKITALKSIAFAAGNKEDVIKKSLSDFIQANRIQHHNAVLALPVKSFFGKRIDLPAMPENELPEAIKWQLKEDAPFELSGALVDFYVLREKAREDGSKMLDTACVLAPQQEIKKYVLMLKEAGLDCLSVAPDVFGYAKLIDKYFLAGRKDEAVAVLEIERDGGSISIHKENKVEFYRQVPFSIDNLKDALRGALVTDKGRVELSAQEAEDVLFKVGVPQGEAAYQDKLNFTQILSMLRPSLERLSQEIRRSLTYSVSQFQGSPAGRILLAGPAADIPNIENFLRQELSLDIRKLSLIDKAVAAAPEINPRDVSAGCAAFGLALGYRQAVNLLPREFRTERFEKLQKVSLRWSAFIAFLLLSVSYLFARIGIGAYQRRLDNALLHLNVLSEVREINERTVAFDRFIAEVKGMEPPAGMMLKKLSNIAPRELFIEDLFLNCEAKTGSIKGVIKAPDAGQDAVLKRFVSDMEDSLYFSAADISSMERGEAGGADFLRFNVVFKIR